MSIKHPLSRRRILLSAAVIQSAMMLAGAVGCGHGSYAEPEHHTPEHKPASYPAAVHQLLALHREIMNDEPPRSERQIDVFAEMFDLIRWLPELAADSDLPKEPWGNVERTSRHWEADLQAVRAAEPEGRHKLYRELETAIDKHLGELVAVSKQFPPEHAEDETYESCESSEPDLQVAN